MLLLKLFEAGILSSQDNDKVRSNSVRALGNFLRYLPNRSYTSGRFNTAVDNAVNALAKSVTTGAVKVRWNACYGIGCMFRNHLLPLGTATWTTTVLSALAQVVKECKNFKVRINAAASLSIPNQRSCYGSEQLFLEVWSSLFHALKSSEEAADFGEYKYRDNLIEQVCGSLVHVSSLLNSTDLSAGLANLLSNTLPSLPQHLVKYKQLMEDKETAHAQRVEELEQAEHHLAELASDVSLTNDQLAIAQSLHQAFLPEEAAAPTRTTFLQTYD